jgi:hypothetical protein
MTNQSILQLKRMKCYRRSDPTIRHHASAHSSARPLGSWKKKNPQTAAAAGRRTAPPGEPVHVPVRRRPRALPAVVPQRRAPPAIVPWSYPPPAVVHRSCLLPAVLLLFPASPCPPPATRAAGRRPPVLPAAGRRPPAPRAPRGQAGATPGSGKVRNYRGCRFRVRVYLRDVLLFD